MDSLESHPYFDKHRTKGRVSTGGSINTITIIDGDQKSLTGASKSISLNSLKQKHPEIKYKEQMWAEVDRHYHEKCECGLKSKATIEMVAQSIYDEQDRPEAKLILQKHGEEKWDFETCLFFVLILFGRNTIQGQNMEQKAIDDLAPILWKCQLTIASDELDKKYGVDILVKDQKGNILGGIQVKPDSFKRNHVKQMNDAWEYPVYHLKYDNLENKNWLNRLEIISHFI